eukprot:3895448-Amphidinium_carterae.1
MVGDEVTESVKQLQSIGALQAESCLLRLPCQLVVYIRVAVSVQRMDIMHLSTSLSAFAEVGCVTAPLLKCHGT